MQTTDIPSKLPIRWGESAGSSFIRSIPTASQIGITDGAASLTDGFVPLNFQPIASGGIPPFGQDMNGILYEISGWARWVAAGGPVFYDSDFATAIGGYPKGAVLASSVTAGAFWVNGVEANATNPDSGGSNWTLLVPAKASAAEVIAGTDNAKYITPLALGMGVLASANGYLQIGGIIIQWATGHADPANTSEPTQVITYPIAFPTAVFQPFVSTMIASATNNADCTYQTAGAPGLSSLTVQRQFMQGGTLSVQTTPKIIVIGN